MGDKKYGFIFELSGQEYNVLFAKEVSVEVFQRFTQFTILQRVLWCIYIMDRYKQTGRAVLDEKDKVGL